MNGRTEELANLIRYHSEKYFTEAEPEITDAEFDALVNELKSLDPNHEVLSEVGAEPSYGKKVFHPTLMGSLDKVNAPESFDRWVVSVGIDEAYTIMPKVDGLAVRLVYENGQLVLAATRGNGCLQGDTKLEFLDGRVLTIQEVVENRIVGRVKCFNVEENKIEYKPIID